jgi:DnaJ domain
MPILKSATLSALLLIVCDVNAFTPARLLSRPAPQNPQTSVATTPARARDGTKLFMSTQNRTGRDFYAILGITRNADEREIKAAYRKLAKQFHPGKRSSVSYPQLDYLAIPLTHHSAL